MAITRVTPGGRSESCMPGWKCIYPELAGVATMACTAAPFLTGTFPWQQDPHPCGGAHFRDISRHQRHLDDAH